MLCGCWWRVQSGVMLAGFRACFTLWCAEQRAKLLEEKVSHEHILSLMGYAFLVRTNCVVLGWTMVGSPALAWYLLVRSAALLVEPGLGRQC